MNILVLYADDWRYDTLGVAGNPVVETPVLDELASSGVRFTHNCVTTSICGVSRASLFTGQWMSRHGNRAFRPWKTAWNATYPGALRNSGYFVGHVGKWHNGNIPVGRFDFSRSYYGTHWVRQPGGQRVHVTQKNCDDAIEFLRARPKSQPFCLTVAFFAPHAEDANPSQYLPQPESTELYARTLVPTPVNATQESFERLPSFIATEKNEGRVRWRWRFDTPAKYQAMMKNYYRLVSEVDAACGRILDELDEQGAASNTLVVFTTDNGYFHGEHGLADKWYPHEESIRVPLIIRDPRMSPRSRGTTTDEITLNVDIAPTILAAAQIDVPESMQGADIGPLYLDDIAPPWREEFFYEHPTLKSTDFIPASEALVRKEWKYIYWPDFDREQLFHLRADPSEESDLAATPASRAKLQEMRKRFSTLKAAAR